MRIRAVTDAECAAGRPALAVVLALTLILLATVPGTVHARLRGFVPSSRRGAAEVWVDVPRFAMPFGDDYVGDYAITDGWGFGLGVSFGLADNLMIEGVVRRFPEGRLVRAKNTDTDWATDLETFEACVRLAATVRDATA